MPGSPAVARLLRLAGLPLLLALATPSCLNLSRNPTGVTPDSVVLPFPTSDEVALVDGRPYTLTRFTAIRGLIKNPSAEAVFWIGISALALQSETRARGNELTAEAALKLARYAMGELPAGEADSLLRDYLGLGPQAALPPPEELRQRLDRVVARSVVQRNPQVLAELH